MIILQKDSQNELVLNINNNARVDFSAYTLTFVHIMSQESKSYTISTSNPLVYTENDRYCTISLSLQQPGQDLNYEGQYQLKIYGNATTLVFTGMVLVEGTEEEPFFTTYVSDNENNSNYIYVE